MKRIIAVIDVADDHGVDDLNEAATWIEASTPGQTSATVYSTAADAEFDERTRSGAFEHFASNLPRLVKVQDLEAPRMLVLSTSHIEADTAYRLDAVNTYVGDPDELPKSYRKGDVGWWFYLLDEPEDRERWKLWPDLLAIRTLAEHIGASWVMLDRDAETVEGLPTYEW